MVYRAHVPSRASAERALSSVPSVGLRSFRSARSGYRRRTDYAHCPLVARAGYFRARNFELNSIGSLEARANYRDALVAFLSSIKKSWTKTANAACTLTCCAYWIQNPEVQVLLNDAPALGDYLDEESREHFAGLCKLLESAGDRFTL